MQARITRTLDDLAIAAGLLLAVLMCGKWISFLAGLVGISISVTFGTVLWLSTMGVFMLIKNER